jgi:hypothetical protein
MADLAYKILTLHGDVINEGSWGDEKKVLTIGNGENHIRIDEDVKGSVLKTERGWVVTFERGHVFINDEKVTPHQEYILPCRMQFKNCELDLREDKAGSAPKMKELLEAMAKGDTEGMVGMLESLGITPPKNDDYHNKFRDIIVRELKKYPAVEKITKEKTGVDIVGPLYREWDYFNDEQRRDILRALCSRLRSHKRFMSFLEKASMIDPSDTPWAVEPGKRNVAYWAKKMFTSLYVLTNMPNHDLFSKGFHDPLTQEVRVDIMRDMFIYDWYMYRFANDITQGYDRAWEEWKAGSLESMAMFLIRSM